MRIQFIHCLSFILLYTVFSPMALAEQENTSSSWVQGDVLKEAMDTTATKVLDKDYIVYHWLDRAHISVKKGGTAPNEGHIPELTPH